MKTAIVAIKRERKKEKRGFGVRLLRPKMSKNRLKKKKEKKKRNLLAMCNKYTSIFVVK